MNKVLSKYIPKCEFDSYEDFVENYKVNVPEDFNFAYDVVDGWAEIDPDKMALKWCNDDFELKEYTFADISRLSNKAANAFRALGIGKGDTVMVILKQRPQVWWCMMGLSKIGAICIPATYQLKKKDIVYRCNAANVKMLISVTDTYLTDNIKSALPDCPGLKIAATAGGEAVDGFLNFDECVDKASDKLERFPTTVHDTMLIYFSSGTTGMPKMVLHDHSLPLGHIVTALFWQRVIDNKVHMTQTDSGWAKFAWGKIYGQWICGACVGAYDTEKFVPDSMLRAMMTIRPSTFCAPATIYRYLIKEDLSHADFSYIEHACVAGEPLNPEVYNQIKSKTGMELREGFGQSETSVLMANFQWFDVRPGSTGKPSPLFYLTLLDDDGNPCEDGVVGTIAVRCNKDYRPVGLFKEYYGDKNANDKAFKNGYYLTGDMAWRDSDGYYWFVGRDDDVIKCSGYRIGPFEVESALLEHPAVLECAVTAVPDPMRGQIVKATIVLARGFSASEELTKELQRHVKKVTAPYKYPRVVEFVDELPKTISGKIKRHQIRQNDSEK